MYFENQVAEIEPIGEEVTATVTFSRVAPTCSAPTPMIQLTLVILR